MSMCETSILAAPGDVPVPDNQDANLLMDVPGGRRVKLEWSCDAPEIDAILSMDERADGEALRATSSFDS